MVIVDTDMIVATTVAARVDVTVTMVAVTVNLGMVAIAIIMTTNYLLVGTIALILIMRPHPSPPVATTMYTCMLYGTQRIYHHHAYHSHMHIELCRREEELWGGDENVRLSEGRGTTTRSSTGHGGETSLDGKRKKEDENNQSACV